jgi:hypothetical protein
VKIPTLFLIRRDVETIVTLKFDQISRLLLNAKMMGLLSYKGLT